MKGTNDMGEKKPQIESDPSIASSSLPIITEIEQVEAMEDELMMRNACEWEDELLEADRKRFVPHKPEDGEESDEPEDGEESDEPEDIL